MSANRLPRRLCATNWAATDQEMQMQEYKAIVNAKVVTEQEIINDGFILYGDGKIVEAGKNCGRLPQGNTEIIDARGCYVGPGFVDIHCHAGGEHWCHEEPEKMALHHLHGGTTSLVCTLYHNIGIDGILSGGKKIKRAMLEGRPGNIAGIHIEGPYLSKKYGATASNARTPETKEHELYLKEFGDAIRQWTVSPEVEGIEPFVKSALDAGIVISLGHSEASPERVYEMAEMGAGICTHITNATGCAISPTRYGGTLEVSFDHAAMLCDSLLCEMINDEKGVHMRPDMTRLVLKTIGISRAVGVTDACAGRDDGEQVNIVDGEIFGSKLKMNQVAKNFRNNTGLGVSDIFRVCSSNPARAIKLTQVGSISPGKDADFVFLDENLELLKVILKGKEVPYD